MEIKRLKEKMQLEKAEREKKERLAQMRKNFNRLESDDDN